MKIKNTKWKLILSLFKDKIQWLLLMIACLILTGVFRSLGAQYIKNITNHIQQYGVVGLGKPLVIICLIQFINYSTKFVSAFSCTYLSKQLILMIRIKLIEKLQSMPYIKFEEKKTGDLQSVIRNDAAAASDYVYILFSRIGVSLFTAFFTLWFMFFINIEMTIAIIIVAIGFGIINQKILKDIKKNEKRSREMLGNMTNVTMNACETMDTIRAYRAGTYFLNFFKKYREKYNQALLNVKKIDGARVGLYTIVNNIALFGSAIYLSRLAIMGKSTLGDVLAYVTLTTQALIAIEMIFRWSARMVSSNAAWDRVNAILEEPVTNSEKDLEKNSNSSSIKFKHNNELQFLHKLTFKDLSYGYNNGKEIFTKQDFEFSRGEICGIIGESGSGKSTLLKCITGLYKSNAGQILADDKEVKYGDLMNLISFVSSDNLLFTGTIFDNIVMGDMNITVEECEDIAQKLGVSDWINALSGKYNYLIEQNGNNLSGGQRQVVCILRALLTKRPIIIMDEPFSALDAERELNLTSLLVKIKQSNIIIMTSHRQGTMACCDKTYQL